MLMHSLHSHTPCHRPQAERLHSTIRKPAPFLGQAHQRSGSFRQSTLLIRAEESSSGRSEDKDFEDKLSKLKTKAKTPVELVRESKGGKKQKYDFTGEQLHLEVPPHRGDLVTNIALGATLLWLPLTIAAVGRAAFLKYRFTDKRMSVITTAPWKNEQLDAAYQEVKDVVTIGRGLGFWGDMVVTLRNNDKIELRSLPQFKELKQYILERRDALLASAPPAPAGKGKGKGSAPKGFAP